ncbi:HD domain-containing protein [Desulfocurvus sp. DL9XJH121]
METAHAPGDVKLYDLVDVTDPAALLNEVHITLEMMLPGFDSGFMDAAFADTIRLFKGEFPGFRSSTTRYHNLQHTLEVFLCAARLLHGAFASGIRISPRLAEMTLVSALFHDTGLIQEEDDLEGTGAKYTVGHENRSVAFLKDYFHKADRPGFDIHDASRMIEATCLGLDAEEIPYGGDQTRFCAQVLATADLLAQMADREYLEKLLLLYLEFAEAGLPYESPHDLLEKTHGFYDMMASRMDGPLGGIRKFAAAHFSARWDIPEDLYDKSIEANMSYLYQVIDTGRDRYFDKLKRGGIVQRIVPLL